MAMRNVLALESVPQVEGTSILGAFKSSPRGGPHGRLSKARDRACLPGASPEPWVPAHPPGSLPLAGRLPVTREIKRTDNRRRRDPRLLLSVGLAQDRPAHLIERAQEFNT